MGLFRTLAVAAIGYWIGERRGERIGARRARRLDWRNEHSGRFRTVAGRRVFDDTATGWDDAPLRERSARNRATIVRRALMWLVALITLWLAANAIPWSSLASLAAIEGERAGLAVIATLFVAGGVARLVGSWFVGALAVLALIAFAIFH
jgi:hypothetical protein